MSERSRAIPEEEFDRYIREAAQMAEYEEGFGVTGCDLSKNNWWVAYVRQSLEDQAQNNRLPEYLLTCAREAKKLGVIVPREYVLYDAVTGEHLERPKMIHLRRELAHGRRIAGVIFPALDRLSREPIHIGVFEFELDHFGVRYHYADGPNGSDPMSQMVRQNLAHAAKFVKLANRKNNRGGNIGRILKGMVPAHKAPYGYVYMADKEIGPNGRVIVHKAWWEIDEMGPDGQPMEGSPASLVIQIFHWTGNEDRTMHWVADTLNDMGITAPEGGLWDPRRIANILNNRSYIGKHAYNVHEKVPNPDKPLTDITAEIKRTMLRQKPEEDWVKYEVPKLIDEELWKRANGKRKTRGRGRGKQAKKIQALLRNRIFCPRCGSPLVVRRNGKLKSVYYYCSRYQKVGASEPCSYRKFISTNRWDGLIWEDVRKLLEDDTWLEEELTSVQVQSANVDKVITLQESRISRAKAKIRKVQEGFESEIYTPGDAKSRIAQHQREVASAEEEVVRLRREASGPAMDSIRVEALREELKTLRNSNLEQATFEEKLELVTRLGIQVFPSEDLTSMRVKCSLGFRPPEMMSDRIEPTRPENGESDKAISECGIVPSAPPVCTKGRTASLSSNMPVSGIGIEYLISASLPLTTSPVQKTLRGLFFLPVCLPEEAPSPACRAVQSHVTRENPDRIGAL